MWVDILLYNRTALSEALRSTENELAALRELLDAGDEAGLRAYLEAARSFREGLDR